MSTLGTENASRCPLCDGPNDCQLCTKSAYKGACWCMAVEIPAALLERVPAEARNRRCICQRCVLEFKSESESRATGNSAPPTDDYYFDRNNLMVFTATYLTRRGYCCDNGCRHCPYPG